jgi:hypothetical protein
MCGLSAMDASGSHGRSIWLTKSFVRVAFRDGIETGSAK